jgi:cysteine desulfurase
MDNHATTRADPRVVEAMLPYFSETFGNAASRNHEFGWRAEAAVETARGRIARLIGASPKEIVFTSGATESNNLALKGLVQRRAERGNHIITCVTEHKAVLDPCRRLEKEGFRVSYLPVGRDGLLDVQRLAEAITAKTILISVMYANNETGVIQPIAEIGRVARERGVALHVDAAQAVGKIPVDVERDAIDLLSLTAHKLYGPKGIGALYVRRRAPRVEIEAQMDGGGHERGMRSGTLNVPAIVGFGRACEICRDEMAVESARLTALRDRLKEGLLARIDAIAVNGSLEHRLPHNLSVSFAGVDGESLLLGLGADVAVSSGSACTSANPEPSHVLRAMGVPERLAHSSIRFGLGRFNTEEEVDYVTGKVEQVVARLRELSPRHAAARK